MSLNFIVMLLSAAKKLKLGKGNGISKVKTGNKPKNPRNGDGSHHYSGPPEPGKTRASHQIAFTCYNFVS